METVTIIDATSDYPTDPATAIKQWCEKALLAEELRVELKASLAATYIEAASLDAVKTTEAFREAYATTQNVVKAQDAAESAVEAKAAEKWADFICEWTLKYESEWEGFNGNA